MWAAKQTRITAALAGVWLGLKRATFQVRLGHFEDCGSQAD